MQKVTLEIDCLFVHWDKKRLKIIGKKALALVWDSGINPEIFSGILNFRDWDFRDSGLLKLPGLGFSGFRIPELQDFAGFPVFRDPEPLPTRSTLARK